MTRNDGRQQPFCLELRSLGGRTLLRCVSPIGRLDYGYDPEELAAVDFPLPVQIHANYDERHQTTLFSTESGVLIRWDGESDTPRVVLLIDSVTDAADRLEQLLLPGEDKPLQDFREELGGEANPAD